MKRVVLSAGILLAAAASHAAVVYDNNFSGNTSGATPPGYFRANATGSTTVTVGSDTVSGNATNQQALGVSVATTSSRTILLNFDNPSDPTNSTPTSLADGDSLKLTLLIRATSLTTTTGRVFRIGLFNDAGTHVTADGNSTTNGNNATTIADDSGYVIRLNTGTNAANDGLTDFDIGKYAAGGSISGLSTDPNSANPRSRDDGTSLNDTTTQHTITLQLTRSGSNILGTAMFDSTAVSGLDAGAVGTSPTAPITSFNTLFLSHQLNIGYFLDEVKVEYIPATTSPEPASLAAAGLSGLLMTRRRRAV